MFSTEVSEKTKLMSLDTWLGEQIKSRKERVQEHPHWSAEKHEGYERGIIDAMLDVKNQIKKLGK